MTNSPDLTAQLRLRPEPPRVTRLSRKVLIGAGGVAGIAIAGALFWALDTNRQRNQSATELYNVDNKTPADGLAGLPKDYTNIPKLGPALPGDLGRPILRAQEQGKPVAAPNIQTPRIDLEEQRRLAEIEAARLAKLFTDSRGERTTGNQQTASTTSPTGSGVDPTTAVALPAETPPLDSGSAQNMQDRKLAFINAEADRRTVSADRVQEKVSPYIVQAGTVIAAALMTGIKSDLPGQITAQVTEHVYDSPTGAHLLIPQGSRLIGQYDSQVAFGQSRVLLVWNRLIMPDGTSIVLERLQGADPQGFSGLEDGVDYHWGQLFRAAALSTLLGIGTEIGSSNDENEIAKAIRESAQDTASDIGQQIVRRQLNIQPTLTIRPGFPVRVIVQRDLLMQPYGAAKEPT
ncbi:conjugation TrbI-like protein [Agrobacterium tumefaciens str. Cherry 2E-2-2]|uniref:Conjugation TrbI-like protein n=2 Tax=Agrobacterium TaxID=357 RepID=A0A1S7R7E4_9HYPH|nr:MULTISPECIES: TrbI/VirB10 family protein [Agrobacterium]EMS96331.1 conjugation TrbI-like protein [Agrobacterium tumefaciens str. Cherry 2E-2-2]AYM82162.1 conjugal transfer protein TrbI [Agrobacterium tumefaciens]NTE90328.1 TrbI/VirB10 family protein [Agrobacterium tumefaciens]CUX17982.1 Conjugation TrbI-like protein [Agrobacterium tumefaciens str. Kerr 14]CUX48207.1 Conjugation TrbI-like protein [Agrobacterium deltaense Zutra 3/1]